MTNTSESALELVHQLQSESAGVTSWVDRQTGCVVEGMGNRHTKARRMLFSLVNEYPCDHHEVKSFLSRVLEREGIISELENALFLALHGLTKSCMDDANVRKLIKRVYVESRGTDLGRSAGRALLEAGVELPEIQEPDTRSIRRQESTAKDNQADWDSFGGKMKRYLIIADTRKLIKVQIVAAAIALAMAVVIAASGDTKVGFTLGGIAVAWLAITLQRWWHQN